LVADEIVEPVGRVGVDETIANPFSSLDRFLDVSHNFKRGFHTVLIRKAGIEAFQEGIVTEPQYICGISTSQRNKLARFRPVDLE
jgi:hypothetical protein